MPSELAGDVELFVQSVLITIEKRMDAVLADEDLTIADASLLTSLAVPTIPTGATQSLDERGRRMRRRLRRLAALGLAEPPPESADSALGDVGLTARGRQVLARLDNVPKQALTDLVGGLDSSERLRLQRAMHLISDRFATAMLDRCRPRAPE